MPCRERLSATCATESSTPAREKKERKKNTSDEHARQYRPQSSITMTSPNISTCLRFPPRVELASASSDRSITLSDAYTSLRLLVPRVGRDTASTPSPVKSTSVACCSAAPSGTADCALALPLPFAELRVVGADVELAVTVDELGGFEVTVEGGDGGGVGLAYS
jgi:hypothetical protein